MPSAIARAPGVGALSTLATGSALRAGVVLPADVMLPARRALPADIDAGSSEGADADTAAGGFADGAMVALAVARSVGGESADVDGSDAGCAACARAFW
jgi:hypothetical protein